jgi:hypothetical protein
MRISFGEIWSVLDAEVFLQHAPCWRQLALVELLTMRPCSIT